ALRLPSDATSGLGNRPGQSLMEVLMFRKLASMVAGTLLVASAASASVNGAETKNLQLFNEVAKSVNHYAWFTIFDDVSASVKDGVVTLTGKVTMPYKSEDLAKRVAKVDGVTAVDNKIEVLPVSQFDDQLRVRIARTIYRNPFLQMYGLGPNPSIHVVV